MKAASASLFAAISIFGASPAQANMVNVTGPGNGWTMFWNAQIGEYGKLYNWYSSLSPIDNPQSMTAFQEGIIPADSKIVFSFSLPGWDIMQARYYNGPLYGYASASNDGQYNYLTNGNTISFNTAPMTAFVSLTGQEMALSNYSDIPISFESAYQVTLNNGQVATATYSVTSLPIPAALPMFAAALLGMVGISRRALRGFSGA